jgi:polyisoprenoid-binding protein YceI
MHKPTVFAVAVLSLMLAVPVSAETRFKVDGSHSFVTFNVQHLGVSNAWGRFNDPSGTIVWDDADPSKSKLDVTLQANKVDTGNAKRDDHLRSPDFFNVKQFPTITFKSTSISPSGSNQYQLTGDLTLHGVTKPITVTLTKVGQADTRMGHRAGFDTEFTVKRSEFGMSFMQEGLGDDVTVHVALEGIRQ